MSDFTGQNLNGYEIRAKIGTGGHGVVYKARHLATGRDVAIKVLRPEQSADDEAIQRFKLEAQVISQLQHPHIVPIHEYWQTEQLTYFVMDWLSGGSLRDAFQRASWSLADTVRMLGQIASALDAAHRSNVVHRDIKPDNILFDEDGKAYLTDFGIAKRLDDLRRITLPGEMVGSPAYLAPEQIIKNSITPRTDIYSLGITLYEALTGEHPFADGLGILRLIIKQAQDPLPSVHEINPTVPRAVDAVLQKATAKVPDDRYPHVLAVFEEFRSAAQGNS